MTFKFVSFVCLAAVFIQSITGQQCKSGASINNNIGNAAGLSLPQPALNVPASSGGAFTVTSSSPISPTGVQVLSENLAIDGSVSVAGQTPFLGTVAIEGQIPSGGQAGVQYSCGNGNVGITSEGANARSAGVGAASGVISPGLNRGVGFGNY